MRAQLGEFTGWLAANGAAGYIGEVGWPNDADPARWNAVAQQWDADAAGLWTTGWAAGEWWGSSYKLSSYVWNTPVTMDGPLALARSQASVIEAQASDRRGVNMAGGEFGTPGPLEATSSFSNANPGAMTATTTTTPGRRSTTSPDAGSPWCVSPCGGSASSRSSAGRSTKPRSSD